MLLHLIYSEHGERSEQCRQVELRSVLRGMPRLAVEIRAWRMQLKEPTESYHVVEWDLHGDMERSTCTLDRDRWLKSCFVGVVVADIRARLMSDAMCIPRELEECTAWS